MSGTSLLSWRRPSINVIVLHGTIAARPGMLSADSVRPLIEKGFAGNGRRPVILDIESPGGSPVQSDLIAGMIRAAADRAGARVHAVIREVGASGGYWIACAADEIHANPMSIVGSIGVVGGGFGFPALLERLGVERRVYTAGTNKARLDPFSPEKPEDVAFARELMDKLHIRFKDWVRLRRGRRLKSPDEAVFDGGYMLGDQALALGLIDTLTTVEDLVRDLAGDRARPRRIAPKRPRLSLRLPRLAVDTLVDALEERAWRIDLR
ncbi:MAG TPA: S49 family peptidase [Acetobacteraceae bacterium]|jgi:signal peptide peptidase SppA|nr:S49 family peptidase [Acetobacteraceae bacterium]